MTTDTSWDDVVGPFLSAEGVQARLGITGEVVVERASRRQLLCVVTTDGVPLFPAWQFTGSQVLPGLSQILALFAEKDVDGWTLAAWLRTPDPDLPESPLTALGRGDVARVLPVARTAAGSLAS